MKELMYAVGFILRLPFFIIGFILWLIIILPLAIFFMLLKIIWIPMAFLGSSFSNRPEEFGKHMKSITDFTESLRLLKDMSDWLQKGER